MTSFLPLSLVHLPVGQPHTAHPCPKEPESQLCAACASMLREEHFVFHYDNEGARAVGLQIIRPRNRLFRKDRCRVPRKAFELFVAGRLNLSRGDDSRESPESCIGADSYVENLLLSRHNDSNHPVGASDVVK